jgi:hypothetical protein
MFTLAIPTAIIGKRYHVYMDVNEQQPLTHSGFPIIRPVGVNESPGLDDNFRGSKKRTV